MPDKRSATHPFMCDQINCESLRPNINIWCVYGLLDNSAHHFTTRCISEGMHNSVVAMPSLSTKLKFPIPFIELSTPLNQLCNPRWSLANNRVDNVRIAEIATGFDRISDMVIKTIRWINDTRDSTLSPLAR
jgi:hypothetical protein